nr:putative disease resistance protein RGA3 [Oryza sativa Japonica Group]
MDETSIFGRDKEKNWVISKLTESSIQQNIKIVSVIGLGGSGKTTLAKLVFNDGNTIKQHFELILWVHVSREFDVEKLVEKLYEAIAGDKPNHLPLQRVSRTISDKLAGKKFLVVMDDVWTEDHAHWEQFMVHLKSGAPGSSILLTARSRKVAEAVDSTYTFDMPFLSEDNSQKVFEQNLGSAAIGLDPEFLQIGTEIMKKCSGVPLAIKVLAGVLRGMKGIEEWQSIRDSNLLDVEDEEQPYGKLRNLQTITLTFCTAFKHLPQCITLLGHLQYVDLSCCTELRELPEGIGALKKLEVLNLERCRRLCGLPADSLKNLTLEGSHGQLLSSGCFFHPRHAAHGHGNESSSSSCIVDVKYPHLTYLKLDRLIGSSSGWEMLRHLTELRTLEISECRDLRICAS